jgi:hypothetical protein
MLLQGGKFMKRKLRSGVFGLAAALLIQSFFIASSLAKGWQPFEFSGRYEKYKYEAKINNRLLYHTFLVEPKDEAFEISYIFKLTKVGREDLEYGFSGQPFRGIEALKPILGAIFQEQEFQVGDELLIPGIGSLTCTGVESLAGLEGKVFVLSLAGSKAKTEFVVKENLGLPLRLTIINTEESRDLEIKLIEYETR